MNQITALRVMTRVGIVLTGCIVLGAIGMYGAGRHLSRPAPAQIGSPPSDFKVQPVVITSGSGARIHGWFSSGEGRGAVLLLPPIRGNRLTMLERARFLGAAGYSTLLIDFQATGESSGDAITFGWRERFDVVAAVHTLRQTAPNEPIGIIGISLGGAAALFAASDIAVQAVILEAVYPSLEAALENRLRMRLGRIGVGIAPLLLGQAERQLGVAASELRPVDKIAQLQCPVLIIGGALDEHTTPADTHLLYEAAGQPKDLWFIPDAAHVDFLGAARARYENRVLAFFQGTLRRRASD